MKTYTNAAPFVRAFIILVFVKNTGRLFRKTQERIKTDAKNSHLLIRGDWQQTCQKTQRLDQDLPLPHFSMQSLFLGTGQFQVGIYCL